MTECDNRIADPCHRLDKLSVHECLVEIVRNGKYQILNIFSRSFRDWISWITMGNTDLSILNEKVYRQAKALLSPIHETFCFDVNQLL